MKKLIRIYYLFEWVFSPFQTVFFFTKCTNDRYLRETICLLSKWKLIQYKFWGRLAVFILTDCFFIHLHFKLEFLKSIIANCRMEIPILNGNYKIQSYFEKMKVWEKTDLFLCQKESLISVNIYYNCIFRIFYRNYWDCWIAPLL